ncbi:MAG: HNH endonuclease [Mycobacterium sp.]
MTERIIRPTPESGTDQVGRTELYSTATKQCTCCREHKAMADMAADRYTRDGYRTVCRQCRADYDRRRYSANRQSILARQREYHHANRGVAWAAGHRARARRYGLCLVTEYLTPDDVIAQWGNKCLYCRVAPFEVIDHLIPVAAGGSHTLMNVLPCCKECNRLKRWSIDERFIRAFRQSRTASTEMSRYLLSGIEAGERNVSVERLFDIADHYGVRPASFLERVT